MSCKIGSAAQNRSSEPLWESPGQEEAPSRGVASDKAIPTAQTKRLERVAVVGTGSWGTALTGLVSPHAQKVVMVARSAQVANGINEQRHNPRHLSDYTLAPNVSATISDEDACSGANALVLAVPSAYLRATCKRIASQVDPAVPVLVLTKGLEAETFELMANVAADELGHLERFAVLSGPNHAEEICRGTVSGSVVASNTVEVAKLFQDLLVCPAFRVYVSSDLTGVEVCGAVKNVIAIACGVAVALGAGDNTLAVLMTRGLAEISRVANALGGDPLTCMGLAGMGDLVATCTSEHSRNRTFGEAFVHGETLQQYEDRTHMVVEGAAAALSVHQLAQRGNIETPITDAVYGILYEGMPLAEAMDALLCRLPRKEFYGLTTSE